MITTFYIQTTKAQQAEWFPTLMMMMMMMMILEAV